jgi:hypothetical protein
MRTKSPCTCAFARASSRFVTPSRSLRCSSSALPRQVNAPASSHVSTVASSPRMRAKSVSRSASADPHAGTGQRM